MFQDLKLEVRDDGADKEATIYRIRFSRLTPRTQNKVAMLFSSPRKPASPTAGAAYYKLSVDTEETTYSAEYNEDTAFSTNLDLMDTLIDEIRKCVDEERESSPETMH
jgi:hypothetical protein